jgi:hypothetical protein
MILREGLIKKESEFVKFCDYYSDNKRVRVLAKILYREAVNRYGSPFLVAEDGVDFKFREVDKEKLARVEAANGNV